MSDDWIKRRQKYEQRETLWQEHIETKRAELEAIFPGAKLLLTKTRTEAEPHYNPANKL